MLCRPCFDHTPLLKSGVRAAPNATVVGHVIAEPGASLWYGSVVRSEQHLIHLGELVAVEDNAVIHSSTDTGVTIGNGTIVGHCAVVHGCTVGEHCLIGMNAVLMNGCVLGDHCLVAAGALVPQGMEIPAGSLVAGSPAKVRRSLTPEEIDRLGQNPLTYARYAEQLDLIP